MSRSLWEDAKVLDSLRLRSRTRNWHLKAERVAAAIGEKKVGRILEIGPGDGSLREILNTTNEPEIDYMAVDISLRSLIAIGDGVRVGGDMSSLPFADGTFDALISIATFAYCRSGEWTAREWLRVLRPGGRLVVIDANRHILKPRTENEPERKRLPGVTRWFMAAGLDVEESQWFLYTPNRPRFLWSLFDMVNAVMPRVPWLRSFSGTYFITGTKQPGKVCAAGPQ